MIKITMIFGEDAVRKYDESKELPSREWLADNGGVVDEKEFETEAEYHAYIAGLNDGDGWTDYQIIRHPDKTEETDTSCGESVWMRAGITVQGSRKEIEKILTGDAGTLQTLLEAGSYEFDGETYIPMTIMEGYNKKHDTDFEEDEIEFHLCIDKKLSGQHLNAHLRNLTDRFVAELSRLPLRPDGWLPHIVYVEEEDNYPVYTMYKLEEIREDGSCVLFNPETGERFNDRHLCEINIDWLDTVLERYYEYCPEQKIKDERHALQE